MTNNEINIRIGTDCSGIETPIIALNNLKINFTHQFSCDNNPIIKRIIKDNFNPKIFYDNIYNRDIGKMPYIDAYICGFPCQSFSSAGLNKGFQDKINGPVFFECLKVIKYKLPIFFILENVKNIINHNGGKTFKTIIDSLNNIGDYNIYYQILNTQDYGLPQNRKRLYIIGILKHFEINKFNFPEKNKLELNLEDIIENKNYETQNILSLSKLEIVQKKKNKYNIGPMDNYAINLNCSYNYATTIYNISPCLLTTCNMVYLTKYNRFLTTKECLKLQGIKNNDIVLNCSENQKYKFIGNSMTVNILMELFKQIFISINI